MKNFDDAAITNALKTGRFKVLEDDESGIMLQAKFSELVFFKQPDMKTAKKWLIDHAKQCQEYPLICLRDSKSKAAFQEVYPNRITEACFEYRWPVSSIAREEFESDLAIEPARPDDLSYVLDHYDLADEDEIRQGIANGELFIAKLNGRRIGRAGFHLEGSMGLLEIDPKEQGKGYGKALEAYVIDQALQKGWIPYCDVFAKNIISQNLQEKMGLIKNPEQVYWSAADMEIDQAENEKNQGK